MMVTARNTFGRILSVEALWTVGSAGWQQRIPHRTEREGKRARHARGGGRVAARVEYKCIRWA